MVNANFKRRLLQSYLDSTSSITLAAPTLVYERNSAPPMPHQVAPASALQKEVPPEDDTYITVAIPESEIYDDPYSSTEGDPSITGPKKKGSWFKRNLEPKREKTVSVRMRKSHFVKYFRKHPKSGQYYPGVVEPPGGRKQFLQQCIFEYESGQMDDQAYEGNRPEDYQEFERKKSTLGKAVGDTADLMRLPYTPSTGYMVG